MIHISKIRSFFLVLTLGALATLPALAQQDNTQIAELYQLQAAFHRAASVRDYINGDSADVITQRIRDMLSLWTSDGVLTLAVGSSVDGNYIGNGDPADASTCPTPSSNPSNRGTLCTFFKYVGGSFKAANKMVSLAPSYKTAFNIQGDMASVYFECHYFNVAVDPNTSKPLWTAASHVMFYGVARKVNGQWLFSSAYAPVPPVPVS